MEEGEELTALQEALEQAHGDVETNLQTIYEHQERVRGLETALAQAEEERDSSRQAEANLQEALRLQKERLREQEEAMLALQSQMTQAVARYRALVVAQAPEVLEELVQGETVEEVDASFAIAKATVERIRDHLAQQATTIRVPIGAPSRSAPDLSLLSPREKIAHGLSRAG